MPPPVDLRLRLSKHNPQSSYSEAEIAAYLNKHFEYMGQKDDHTAKSANTPHYDNMVPCDGIVNWYQKEAATARLISHLPPYVQKLLIEKNCKLKLHPNRASVREAYSDAPNTTDAFYAPNSNSIHWAMGDDADTHSFLHEIGHAIDFEKHAYISDLPQFNIANAVANYLSSLRTDVRGRPLNLLSHLAKSIYTPDTYARETVAVLFAVSTLLSWQYPNHPQTTANLMHAHYDPIWTIIDEKYLPTLERKAMDLYDQKHPPIAPPTVSINGAVPNGPLTTPPTQKRGAES